MKDQFGNDKNRHSINRQDDNNTIYNDTDRKLSDMDINDRERSINVHGNSAFDRDERMADLDRNLVGIFETEREANNVIVRLKEIGYHQDDITVIAKNRKMLDRLQGNTDKMGTGAAIGGTLGGIAASLPALGVLAIPGIGPILAAGPLAVILGGVIAGGVTGGIIGAFLEMGVSEKDAEDYQYQLDQGKIIVLVENRENMRKDVYRTFRENNSLKDNNNTPRY